MSNIWFTSDTHGYHRNISGPKVSRWGGGYRDFDDEVQMTKHLLEQINKYVKEDDILYHLGDFTFGGIDKIWEFRKQIKCKNIHLILGNHDHHIEHNKRLPNCYYNLDDQIIVNDMSPDYYWTTVNAILLFSSVQYVKTVRFGNQSIFLSHYKHFIWEKSHHGRIHLYGHSHASAEHHIIGKSMDCGVDNAYCLLGEYRPFNLTEILDLMSKREILLVDHHNSKTNE